jgi:hypothetical protein
MIGSKYKVLAAVLFVVAMVGMNMASVSATNNGPPAQSQVFVDQNGTGHTFSENYWDINVTNDSAWQINNPSYKIQNQTTWVNNTWNIIWISEGNFQMGMLAFMNKSGDNIAAADKYFTPAQFWWMHYYYQGNEMLIGNMLSAWFGFNDTAGTGEYVPGVDDMNPLMYMTMEQPGLASHFYGLVQNTSVITTPLQRTTGGSEINYTWAYNYTNIEFWVPKTNHTTNTFQWGFNYTDPGTYMSGSFGLGVQTYIYYKYTLVLDSSTNTATLYNGYKSGDLKQLYLRTNQSNPNSAFELTNRTSGQYMPKSWIYCLGNWAFIMAGRDQAINLNSTNSDGNITANSTLNGVTDVHANVGGQNVFNYQFTKSPDYTQYELNNPADHTTVPVLYATIGVNNNSEFLSLVSGMTQLIGPFSRLMISYAINQTNHFTNGISFDDAWSHFDPTDTAAFFVTGYPQFGPYGGGAIDHDPVFSAYWTPGTTWGVAVTSSGIPGAGVSIFLTSMSIGVVMVVMLLRKRSLAV